MAEKISGRKWVLLGFGVINIVMLFLPIARGELYDYYVVSIPGTWGTFLLLALLYFPLLVPLNGIIPRFYSTGYYDTIIKVMNVVIPILGILALIFARNHLNLASSESFTLVYYGLYALIVVEYGYNCYITFKSLY